MGNKIKITTKKWKIVDTVVFSALPLLAILVSLSFRVNFLISMLLFYGSPSLYLVARNSRGATKRALFFACLALPVGIVGDYLAATDLSWIIPISVFPIRLFGKISIEGLIWGFLTIFSVTMFYEHFLDKGRHTVFDKNMKYLACLALIIVTLFLSGYLLNQQLLHIDYLYLKGGFMALFLPAVLFLCFYPRFIGKYVKIMAYFFVIAVLHEITGLQLGHWTFPGNNFIGWVTVSSFKIPLEEMFYYMFIFTVAILSYFEYFDDNHLKREARKYT